MLINSTLVCASLFFVIGSLEFENIPIPFTKTFDLALGTKVTISEVKCSRIFFSGASFSYNRTKISFVTLAKNQSFRTPTTLKCSFVIHLKSLVYDKTSLINATVIIPNDSELEFKVSTFGNLKNQSNNSNHPCAISSSKLQKCTILPVLTELVSVNNDNKFFLKILDEVKKLLNLEIRENLPKLTNYVNQIILNSGKTDFSPPSPYPPYVLGTMAMNDWAMARMARNVVNQLPLMLDKSILLRADFPSKNSIRVNTTLEKDFGFSFDNWNKTTPFRNASSTLSVIISEIEKIVKQFQIFIPKTTGISVSFVIPYLACSASDEFTCAALRGIFIENIRSYGEGFYTINKLIDNFIGPKVSNLFNLMFNYKIDENGLNFDWHTITESANLSVSSSPDSLTQLKRKQLNLFRTDFVVAKRRDIEINLEKLIARYTPEKNRSEDGVGFVRMPLLKLHKKPEEITEEEEKERQLFRGNGINKNVIIDIFDKYFNSIDGDVINNRSKETPLSRMIHLDTQVPVIFPATWVVALLGPSLATAAACAVSYSLARHLLHRPLRYKHNNRVVSIRRLLFDDIVLVSGCFIAAYMFIWSNLTNAATVQVGGEYDVRSFSLVTTVRDMWNAGLYPLSIFICFFSGIYPYVKLILILWYCVFRQNPHSRVLHVLDNVGKFSLMDTFVMTMLKSALEVKGIAVVVPKLSFYLFVWATVLSIAIGNYAKYLWRFGIDIGKHGLDIEITDDDDDEADEKNGEEKDFSKNGGLNGLIVEEKEVKNRTRIIKKALRKKDLSERGLCGDINQQYPPISVKEGDITDVNGGEFHNPNANSSSENFQEGVINQGSSEEIWLTTDDEIGGEGKKEKSSISHEGNGKSGEDGGNKYNIGINDKRGSRVNGICGGGYHPNSTIDNGRERGLEALSKAWYSKTRNFLLKHVLYPESITLTSRQSPSSPSVSSSSSPLLPNTSKGDNVSWGEVEENRAEMNSVTYSQNSPRVGSGGYKWDRILSIIAFVVVVSCSVTACTLDVVQFNISGFSTFVTGCEYNYSLYQIFSRCDTLVLTIGLFTTVIAPCLYLLMYPKVKFLSAWCATDTFLLTCVASLIQLTQFIDYVLGHKMKPVYSAKAALLWPLVSLLVSMIVQWIFIFLKDPLGITGIPTPKKIYKAFTRA